MDNEKKEYPILPSYVEGVKCILCGGFVPFCKAPCVCQKCKELWKLLKEKFL